MMLPYSKRLRVKKNKASKKAKSVREPIPAGFTYQTEDGLLKGRAAWQASLEAEAEDNIAARKAERKRKRKENPNGNDDNGDQDFFIFYPDDYDVGRVSSSDESEEEDNGDYDSTPALIEAPTTTGRKRRENGMDLKRMADAWQPLLPQLLKVYIYYRRASRNFETELDREATAQMISCSGEEFCSQMHKTVTFFEKNRQYQQTVTFCNCTHPVVQLARMGFIAASPVRPVTAVSFDMLDHMHTLWQSTLFSIDGFLEGVWNDHAKRGGVVLASKSHKSKDGRDVFRRALHVYRDLLLREDAMKRKLLRMTERDMLASSCPLCFGPRKEGDLMPGDVDYYVALDGNFGHFRWESASKHDFANMNPRIFLVTKYINQARQQFKDTGTDHGKAGDEACSDGWKAKDGGVKESTLKGKADSGLFGMVCSHEVCLKMVNLYKTGEKQHYPYALLEWLLREVDPDGKVGIMYDISCNFEAHLKKRGLLKEEREKERMKFAVSIFHAYAHIWQCQLRYSPRLIDGFGRRDGEGCERIWSKLVGLIRLNRQAGSSLRLMNIHFRVDFTNDSSRLQFVSWLRRHYADTSKCLKVTTEDLRKAEKVGWNVEKLKEEWKRQKEAQSKAGSSAAKKEREERYRRLGELAGKEDEFQEAWAGLDNSVGLRDLIGITRYTETARKIALELKTMQADKAKVARELGADTPSKQQEMVAYCKIHGARVEMRALAIQYLMTLEPINDVKRHKMAQLGIKKVTALAKKIDSSKLKKAIIFHDKAVDNYVKQAPTENPPEKAKDVESVLKRQHDDPFWADLLFDDKDSAWAVNKACRDGINAMVDHDRCLEELCRLRAEMTRMIRWANARYVKIQESFDLWAYGVLDHEESKEGDEDGEVGLQTDAFPTEDKCLMYLYLLAEIRKQHLELEERWLGDGLERLWLTQPNPELWRSGLSTEVRHDQQSLWEEIDEEIDDELQSLLERHTGTMVGGRTKGALNFNGILEEVRADRDRLLPDVGPRRDMVDVLEEISRTTGPLVDESALVFATEADGEDDALVVPEKDDTEEDEEILEIREAVGALDVE